jgi:alanyl-tRNA synthetase
MTKRLYYQDCYLKEFSGAVIDQRRAGNSPVVVLDQTAFYPTSGGQPHDSGTIDAAHVADVLEDSSGLILHVLDREIPLGQVSGRIDWERRFDHMQQHTGQHILSQAFIRTAHAPTLSFHMGQETSTIDIQLAQPSPLQIEETQALATSIVFEDRAVHILTTDRDSLQSLGVRKESQREGEIRVVDVEGFDRSPCGGTHVQRTGEIGVIFILDFERYKGGTRVEFVAGNRALKFFLRDHELLRQLGKLHSASPDDLPRLTEKLLQERSALSRNNAFLQDQFLEMEAEELLRGAIKTASSFVVRKSFADRNMESIKMLAQKLTARPGIVAILGIPEASQLVVARSKDLPGNCNDAIKQAAARFGGKGGGKPELAQAGGFSAEFMDSWLAALEEYFSRTA